MTQSFADPGTPQDGGATRTASVDLTANVSGYTTGMTEAAQQTGVLASSVDQLQQRMAGLNKWAGKKLMHFAAADFAVLAGATVDAATFEKQLGTLSATAAVTGTSMHGIKNGIETAFTKFPVARGQVIDLVESITNLGVTSASSIGSLTQTFVKLGAATGEPMTQLAGGLIQLSRLMGSTDAGQIGNYANALLTVAKNAGVSSSQVLDFSQSIAPVARQAGIGTASVISIGTAFTKAGADGYVAANTFNSIMSDITNSIATGSPDMAKYANLIGMTTDQFKKADPTNRFVQIFTQIGKQGPQAIALLNSLGITGQRAQAAIAAITQSGDLASTLALGGRSQGDQKNLTKGSEAAFNSLADSMARMRNQFTQFGTEIGTTFLTPLTAAANVAAKVAAHVNGLVKPFAPVIASLGAVAGVASGVGSVAMSAAGAIGTYALVRSVRRSRAVGSFRAGMRVGGPGEDLSPGSPSDRYTAGTMGRAESGVFLAGTGLRRNLTRLGMTPAGSGASPWRSASTWRNALVAGPMVTGRMYSRMNEQLMKGEMGGTAGTRLPFGERLDLWGRSLQGRTMLDVAQSEAKPLAAQVGRTANATAGVGMQMLGKAATFGWKLAGPTIIGGLVGGATGVAGGGRLMNAGRKALPANIDEQWAKVTTSASATAAALKGLDNGTLGIREGFKMLGSSSKDLAGALASTAGSVLGRGIGATVSGTAKIAGTALSYGAKGVGMLARTAFSLPGIVGIEAGQRLWSQHKEADAATDVSRYLNPIQKYNDALGTTTSNLASFNQALTDGANGINNGQGVKSMADAAKVTGTDTTTAGHKPKNDYYKTLAHTGSNGDIGRSQALAAAFGALPINDPKQLQAAKEDALAAGASPAVVQAALKQYMAAGVDRNSGVGKNIDYGALGQAAADTEGVKTKQGYGFNPIKDIGTAAQDITGKPAVVGTRFQTASKPGAKILGLMLSGINSQQITDTSIYGGVYAQQKALASYSEGLAPLVQRATHGKGGQDAPAQKALADTLNKIAGGDKGAYQNYINKHFGDAKTTSMAGQQQFVIDTLGATAAGRRYVKNLTKNGGTSDMSKVNETLVNLSNRPDGGSFNSLLRKSGGELGTFAADNKDVQAAIGGSQGSPGAVTKSIDLILKQATKLGGGFDGAIAKLSEFQGAIGDTSSVLYKQVTAAQQEAVTRAGYQQPFQSRAKNFGSAVSQYTQAVQVYNNTPAGKQQDDQETLVKTARANYETALADQQSYLQQMYQTAQSYGTQMQRAAEDENTSIYRSNQQFHIQMRQANEDYLTGRNRSQADHDRQLANQVATSAQSIYNPYQRVQAQYALSGGEVLDNLTDQNRRMHEQMAQVRKLHQEGLSTQAIQTLDLTNPANAQQTAGLASSLQNNPEQIAKINKQIGQRVKETKGLTQNAFSLGFIQAEKDYSTGLARAEEDYNRSTKRAEAAQQLSLSNMADDYNKTVKRAGEDLTTSMTEVTGQFGAMYDKTMGQIAKSVQKFSPMAAAQMKKDLGSLVQAFPYLLTGQAAAFSGNTQYISTPGTMGINAQGKLGTYDKNGKFHAAPANTSVSPSANLPHIAPPVPKHAMGGIATSAQQGIIGEAGPEAIIPLNERGQAFMASLIAKAFGQAMQMVTVPAHTSSSTSVDSSTNFTGPINVSTQDTAAFAREMKAKARLARLSSPVRH